MGMEVVNKEILHYKKMIERLTAVLLMTKEKGIRYLHTCFSPKTNKLSLNLGRVSIKGYSSSLNISRVEAFLLARFEGNN